jgi:Cu/Ag efflux protein CusF
MKTSTRAKNSKIMNPTFGRFVLCGALLAAGPLAAAGADTQTPADGSATMTREESVLLSETATVEAIDLDTREVTLKGPLGNEVSFVVDQRVRRLNEIKVGDTVTANYYVSIAAELREPTPDEQQHPITLLEGAGKAPPGTSPAAGGLRRFKVVTTVEGLDRPTQTVTIKGPRGNYLTVRVADPANLTKMRIGDNIVITYTEALAISVKKAKKADQD